ncbi:MAG: hypothetical protein LBR83_00270 [Clostridiales bacterium]|jgi:hypothetical protein|nr:hypothetical protein [Clostridiales bacterium]
MTAKERTLLGMALKALVKVGADEEVNKIIDYMSQMDKPTLKEESE